MASGKSTAINLLQKAIPCTVFDCDKIANDVLNEQDTLKEIAQFSPESVKNVDGLLVLDRKSLGQTVFSNKALLEKLNNLTHPKILEKLERLVENSQTKINFVEIQLLFECKLEDKFDQVIVVLRDREERILSSCERSKISRADAENRINSQIDHEKIDLSKYVVIRNDGTKEGFLTDVQRAVEKILLDFDNGTF